jgi:hypothetical protein
VIDLTGEGVTFFAGVSTLQADLKDPDAGPDAVFEGDHWSASSGKGEQD